MSPAGGTALGSAIGGAFGLIGSGLEYGYNKALAEQQNQYNIDMWKMQAEYNSPQAQMQRFQEAGLNPNLIYGQGNNGNMSQAPQMITPQAPHISRQMQEIAQAFNIEALRTNIAERKSAEANALNAETDAKRNVLQLTAELNFGRNYFYDMSTGRYVERPEDPAYHVSVIHPSAYYFNRILANSDPRMQNMAMQRAYLSPQIWMANFEKEHYPVTYWIGAGSQAAKGISDLTGVFNPSRYLMPVGKNRNRFITPSGRVLNY